jgi:tetratricopeptide (TPR) repeat protein
LPRAAAYLEKAYTQLPTHGEAAVFYGAVLAKLNKVDEASDVLKEVISHPTWGPQAWMYLGEVRRRQGKWKDATDNLAAAKREFSKTIGPSSRISLLQTEWAYYYSTRYDWNHPDVFKSLETGRTEGDADEPELNLAYAIYYLKRKQPDSAAALEAFEKVLQVLPHRCDAIQGALANPTLNAKRRVELETARASACSG